jgi:NAD(P)-dependent dehydrogenase (short-subunit alcohol dehydrogenase family)
LWPIVGYLNGRDRANELIQELGSGEAIQLDLLREKIELPDNIFPIESIIHCAGLPSAQKSLFGAPDVEISRLLEVHALGPLRLTKAIAASSISRLRSVVVVLSVAAICDGGGPYALSKATALAMTKLLATELRPQGISVHAVVPGWTETPMAETAARNSGRRLSEVRAQHLDQRLLAAAEVGDLCVELATDERFATVSKLAWWDRRSSRDPIWLDLKSILNNPPRGG